VSRGIRRSNNNEEHNGEPFVTLAVPVRDEQNRVTGVLSAEVNLKHIWDVIANMKIGSMGYAYVVDGKGRLIAHRNPSLVLQGQDLSAMKVVRDALQGRAVAASYKGLEGQDVIGHYQPFIRTPTHAQRHEAGSPNHRARLPSASQRPA
jgi:hypothetical protein